MNEEEREMAKYKYIEKQKLVKDLSDVIRDSLLPVGKGHDCLSQLHETSKAIASVLAHHGLILGCEKGGFVLESTNH